MEYASSGCPVFGEGLIPHPKFAKADALISREAPVNVTKATIPRWCLGRLTHQPLKKKTPAAKNGRQRPFDHELVLHS